MVDDHAVMRWGVVCMLKETGEFDVVAEASNGEEAAAAAVKLRPDVVLMDINMPLLDGITATQRILSAMPEARIVLTSVDGGQERLAQSIAAGAAGFLPKGSPKCDLVGALHNAVGR
ncbi:MAG TPA: response regulator transcription factor [Arthrobacter sp.]|nr:response regulator transcription factor [Arthrobacter sp.]